MPPYTTLNVDNLIISAMRLQGKRELSYPFSVNIPQRFSTSALWTYVTREFCCWGLSSAL